MEVDAHVITDSQIMTKQVRNPDISLVNPKMPPEMVKAARHRSTSMQKEHVKKRPPGYKRGEMTADEILN